MKLKNKNIQCNYITRRKASMNIPSKPLRRSKIKTNFFYKIKLKNYFQNEIEKQEYTM
jgi:hypothetical protein